MYTLLHVLQAFEGRAILQSQEFPKESDYKQIDVRTEHLELTRVMIQRVGSGSRGRYATSKLREAEDHESVDTLLPLYLCWGSYLDKPED